LKMGALRRSMVEVIENKEIAAVVV
jgi:hypothetical protein